MATRKFPEGFWGVQWAARVNGQTGGRSGQVLRGGPGPSAQHFLCVGEFGVLGWELRHVSLRILFINRSGGP